MGGHTLTHHALHSGEADTVLVLQQLAHRADTPVAQMVDIVIVAQTILQMHIIIDGRKNIFLGNMFRDQFMHILLDGLRQLLRILAKFLNDLRQHGIIYPLRHAQFSGVAVHEISDIHHHIGQHLHIALLGLYIHKGDRRILDRIGKFCRYLGAGGSHYLAGGRIDGISRQHLVSDAVAQRQLLIEFISSDFGQIISTGVKKHGAYQALGALHAQGLAGTDLFV